MLLRQFKGTGPGSILLILVTLAALWSGAFINLHSNVSLYVNNDPMPLYGILLHLMGKNPLPGLIFTLSVASIMSFMMVNLNTRLLFINERTFIPALFYILLGGLFPEYQLLNPAIFGAVFLMMSVRRIMEAFRIPGTAYNFFDAGILISTGSLFYANLIWFGSLVIIGIALFRTVNIKEIAISIIGLITPYILTFGIYYLSGKDLKSLYNTLEYNLFDNPASYIFNGITIAAVIFAALVTMVSLIHLFISVNTKKVKSRTTFNLLVWMFIISIAVYTFLPTASVEIIWITAIPVSYFLSDYFVLVRKKLVPEILFSVLFILVFLIQIMYLK
jgi:hypothetical protein